MQRSGISPHKVIGTAIDLGGSWIRSSAVLADAELTTIRKEPTPETTSSPADLWHRLTEQLARHAETVSPSPPSGSPLAISFPGPVEDGRRILSAPTVTADRSDMPQLAWEMEQRTGRPTRLINDVSAATWHIANEVPHRRFMVLTISSGIGSKVFDRSHPAGVLDDTPYAGELGHLVVDSSPTAPLCGCGGQGHLGMVASGRGIELHARKAACDDPASFRRSLCHRLAGGSAQELDNERHLAPALRAGDEWASGVLERCTAPLARTLATTTLAYGLEKIFVIGGFAQALGQTYVDVLSRLTFELLDYHVARNKLDELLSLWNADEETCLQGAAVFCCHMLEQT